MRGLDNVATETSPVILTDNIKRVLAAAGVDAALKAEKGLKRNADAIANPLKQAAYRVYTQPRAGSGNAKTCLIASRDFACGWSSGSESRAELIKRFSPAKFHLFSALRASDRVSLLR